jgi:hypothetical protein
MINKSELKILEQFFGPLPDLMRRLIHIQPILESQFILDRNGRNDFLKRKLFPLEKNKFTYILEVPIEFHIETHVEGIIHASNGDTILEIARNYVDLYVFENLSHSFQISKNQTPICRSVCVEYMLIKQSSHSKPVLFGLFKQNWKTYQLMLVVSTYKQNERLEWQIPITCSKSNSLIPFKQISR